jgi:RNA polymerase sigma factor (sigma-70 family)
MSKQYYLTIQGKKVEVSEEVYRAYKQPIRKERKRSQRKWRCRNGKGVRCNNRCEECGYALAGHSAVGNDLSLEELVANEAIELANPNDLVEEIYEKERSEEIIKIYNSLTEDQRYVVDRITEGWSQKRISEELGISISAIHQRMLVIRKKFEKVYK